jgi:hypothetical protein
MFKCGDRATVSVYLTCNVRHGGGMPNHEDLPVETYVRMHIQCACFLLAKKSSRPIHNRLALLESRS